MGYLKTKVLPSTATAEYWRVVQINCNIDRADAVVTLHGYASKAARLANAQPLTQVTFDLGADFHGVQTNDLLTGDAMLEAAYVTINAQAVADDAPPDVAWFADAVHDD